MTRALVLESCESVLVIAGAPLVVPGPGAAQVSAYLADCFTLGHTMNGLQASLVCVHGGFSLIKMGIGCALRPHLERIANL